MSEDNIMTIYGTTLIREFILGEDYIVKAYFDNDGQVYKICDGGEFKYNNRIVLISDGSGWEAIKIVGLNYELNNDCDDEDTIEIFLDDFYKIF